MTQDGLEARREALTELEKSEQEAKRLEEALERGRLRSLTASAPASVTPSPTSPSFNVVDDIGTTMDTGGEGSEQDDNPASTFLPPHPGPSPVKRRAPGMGLLSALSYTIHGMMDTDPESARRSGIGKTRETISQVAAHFVCMVVNG
jgi:sorting nexin-41/42